MEIGTVQSVDIDQQMRTAYLDYAMSVIVARGAAATRRPICAGAQFPDRDDGLRGRGGRDPACP